jgi:hypothetical protein
VARQASARRLDAPYLRAQLPLWERLTALGPQLPAYLNGERHPANNEDRVALARLCIFHRLYAAAARFYADAFAGDARLASDLKAELRGSAACCAALAGCGKGGDGATLDEKEKARLRGQALTWLNADLALQRQQLASGKAADRQEAQAQLRHRQQASDFAGVRGEKALAALPPEERLAWTKVWQDVATLLAQASEQ